MSLGKKKWSWLLVFTQVNGVGLHPKSLTFSYYNGDELVGKAFNGEDMLRRWFAPKGYLPRYGSAQLTAGVSTLHKTRTHGIYTLVGIDDNGSVVVAEGRLDFADWK